MSSSYYIANLFPINNQELCITHSTEELIYKIKNVTQFDSGVFIAIDKKYSVEWDYDCLPITEDDGGFQHPLAEIEIRAFDFSYFEIYGNDVNIKNILISKLSSKVNNYPNH